MSGDRTFTSSKSERADRFSQLVYPVRKKDITLQLISVRTSLYGSLQMWFPTSAFEDLIRPSLLFSTPA